MNRLLVLVPASVLLAIAEAVEYSLTNFGPTTARKMRDALLKGLEDAAWREGSRLLDMPAGHFYFSVKPYRFIQYRDHTAGRAIIYLLWHTVRQMPTAETLIAAAEQAAREARPWPFANNTEITE